MNKAFVREPEADGRAYCPRCGALGVSVGAAPMDTNVKQDSRTRIGDSAWFCSFSQCEVAYFNLLEAVVTVDELKTPVYPQELDAPLCACFGFKQDDIEADVRSGRPTRIRELLAKSRSPAARCQTLAVDGRCCIREVQRLYLKLREEAAQ